MINCKICNKSFPNMISWRHLKTHNLTTKEYKEKYGSLVSKDFRNLKSKQNSGENNPNFGNKLSESKKELISKSNQGKVPHNYGKSMSEEQKSLLSEKALKRNQKWKENNNHPLFGRTHTEESKQKIRNKRKLQKITKEQAYKAIETKKENGYDLAFFKGKTHNQKSKDKISKTSKETARNKTVKSINESKERLKEFGYTLVSVNENIITIRCNKCNSKFNRTRQYSTISKIKKDMCRVCYPINTGTSDKEKEVVNFLSEYCEVIQNDKTIINPKELDIVIPEHNLAIEFNGLYWHSEIYKDKNYHINKKNACSEQGLTLVQIFEDEWQNSKEIVKSRLLSLINRNTKTIGARKCLIQEINSKTANTFLKENHLQGSGRSHIRYGLYYNSVLVSVMTFLKGDISKNLKEWELNRFCSLKNHQIIGGASKLFFHFIKDIDPNIVVSFSDLRWSNYQNSVYKNLGFCYDKDTGPNYWYIMPNEIRRYHRYGLKKPLNSNLSERELRINEGWLRIYDCGSSKWIWSKR